MSVDYDGKTAYTNAIIIRKDINTIIDVLGNPVKSTINLNISNKDAATYQLVLYSLNGIKLGSMMYNHSGGTGFVTMPVPANAKGQCILQIINGNEKQMVKVVVE